MAKPKQAAAEDSDPASKEKKLQDYKAWRLEMREAKKRKRLELRTAGSQKGKQPAAADEAADEAPASAAQKGKRPKKRAREDAEQPAQPEQPQQPAPTKKRRKATKASAAEGKAPEAAEASAAAAAEEEADPEAFKVVVAGIPTTVEEDTLRRDFGVCGEILSLRLLRDRETKKSRGIAFISFTNQASLDSALEYHGDNYGGRSLVVQVAKKDARGAAADADPKGKGGKGKGKGKLAGPGEKPDGCTSVIVKGLAFSVSEADLRKLFAKCGNGPTHVNVLMDKATGASKGMAFVDFDCESAVDEAILLHGSELKGRRFSMDYATPRAKCAGPGKRPEGCLSVVVKGLDYAVTEEELRRTFGACAGGPTQIRMATDRSGASRGIAFLDFASEAGVEAAVAMHGQELKGWRFILDYAMARDESGKVAGKESGNKNTGAGKKPEGCTSIIVRNLAAAVAEKHLMKVFRECGEGPRNVNLVMDEDGTQHTGKAFVNFSSEAAVDAAMALSGTELKGQSFTIGYVKPKARSKQ